MGVSKLLEIQLRGKFAYAAPERSNAPLADGPTEAEIAAMSAAEPTSFLGRPPCTAAELARSIEAAHAALERSELHQSAATVGSLTQLTNAVLGAYARERVRLESLYRTLGAALAARGVLDPASLRVVAVVCAGGTPFRELGLGDNSDAAVARQLEIALTHGIVFELIPVLFTDVDHNIARLGVGVGGALLAALRRRDAGRGRLDGVLFACKGTLAAALATRSYVAPAVVPGAVSLALLGMGTDLSQGFFDLDKRESARLAAVIARVVVFNSDQDAHVGHAGRAALETFGAVARGVRVDCEWVDVEPLVERFAGGRNPEHLWYCQVFSRPRLAELRARMLVSFANAVGARAPPEAAARAAPPVSPTTKRRAAAVSKLASGKSVSRSSSPSSVFGELANFDRRELRETETKVLSVAQWVGAGEIFISE